jgi:hypothetical protein
LSAGDAGGRRGAARERGAAGQTSKSNRATARLGGAAPAVEVRRRGVAGEPQGAVGARGGAHDAHRLRLRSAGRAGGARVFGGGSHAAAARGCVQRAWGRSPRRCCGARRGALGPMCLDPPAQGTCGAPPASPWARGACRGRPPRTARLLPEISTTAPRPAGLPCDGREATHLGRAAGAAQERALGAGAGKHVWLGVGVGGVGRDVWAFSRPFGAPRGALAPPGWPALQRAHDGARAGAWTARGPLGLAFGMLLDAEHPRRAPRQRGPRAAGRRAPDRASRTPSARAAIRDGAPAQRPPRHAWGWLFTPPPRARRRLSA